jgi:hypothetical protein
LQLRKHVANTDVAIDILRLFYVEQKSLFKLRVRWYRILHPPTDMGFEQRIEIPLAEWSKWEPYTWQPQGHPTPVIWEAKP